jgi:hypothetical protein
MLNITLPDYGKPIGINNYLKYRNLIIVKFKVVYDDNDQHELWIIVKNHPQYYDRIDVVKLTPILNSIYIKSGEVIKDKIYNKKFICGTKFYKSFTILRYENLFTPDF